MNELFTSCRCGYRKNNAVGRGSESILDKIIDFFSAARANHDLKLLNVIVYDAFSLIIQPIDFRRYRRKQCSLPGSADR